MTMRMRHHQDRDEYVVTIDMPSETVLLLGLLGVAALLALLHAIASSSGLEVLVGYLDMDDEKTVPTWWSSVQLLLLGILLGVLAYRQSGRDRRSGRALYFGSVFAVFFSLDEVATLHESVTRVLKRFESVPRFPGQHGIWILVYGILGLAVLAVTLPGLISFFRAERSVSLKFLVGAILFALGGVGVEIVGYYTDPSFVLVEETLEVIGVAVMVWAVYGALTGTTIEFHPIEAETSNQEPATRPRSPAHH